MKTTIIIVILLAGLSFGTVRAQSFDKAKMDQLFDVLAQKEKAMGSLTLSKNGNVIYRRTIGYSSIADADKQPSTSLTRYRINKIHPISR